MPQPLFKLLMSPAVVRSKTAHQLHDCGLRPLQISRTPGIHARDRIATTRPRKNTIQNHAHSFSPFDHNDANPPATTEHTTINTGNTNTQTVTLRPPQ